MPTAKHLTRATPLPAGGALFELPDGSRFMLYWQGPGSRRLYLTTNTPGVGMIPVEPDRFALTGDTFRHARDAAERFAAEGREA